MRNSNFNFNHQCNPLGYMSGINGGMTFGPSPYPYNGVNQPDLMLVGTGRLSPIWVDWYRNKTGATLPEAMKTGVGRMLALQQQMVEFFNEYTLNPTELLVSYPDYAPSDAAAYNSYFYNQVTRNGRYAPRIEPFREPSPFDNKTVNVIINATTHAVTVWEGWCMAGGASQEEAKQAREALCKRLEAQERIQPENRNIAPHVSADAVNVDLVWLLYMADCHPQATLTEIQRMGEQSLGLAQVRAINPDNINPAWGGPSSFMG